MLTFLSLIAAILSFSETSWFINLPLHAFLIHLKRYTIDKILFHLSWFERKRLLKSTLKQILGRLFSGSFFHCTVFTLELCRVRHWAFNRRTYPFYIDVFCRLAPGMRAEEWKGCGCPWTRYERNNWKKDETRERTKENRCIVIRCSMDPLETWFLCH